jgi:hypothetical protein
MFSTFRTQSTPDVSSTNWQCKKTLRLGGSTITLLYHRYLMSRLSVQVFYLWRHVSLTAPPFILWWSNLEILFGPLHCSSPFLGELCCQAIQTEHGPYIAERTQKAVYIVRCLCHVMSSRKATLLLHSMLHTPLENNLNVIKNNIDWRIIWK